MKESMLNAMSNVLKRKRQELMAEEQKIDELLKKAKFPTKESPPKEYLDKYHVLKAEVTKLSDAVDALVADDKKDL